MYDCEKERYFEAFHLYGQNQLNIIQITEPLQKFHNKIKTYKFTFKVQSQWHCATSEYY